MMSNLVEFSILPAKNHEIGLIILNRPERINALNYPMCDVLSQRLAAWEKNERIKAVIIRGKGEKGFCAGGDIRLCYEIGQTKWTKGVEFFDLEYRLNSQIFHFSKPYIALLHGISMGGGLGVSIHGSHRIAAPNLKLAMPETGIGFFPDIGASYFLSRCPGQTGLYLGLTGLAISAADARHLRLIDKIVALDEFDRFIQVLTGLDLNRDVKRRIDEVLQSFSGVIKPEDSELAKREAQIDKYFNQSSLEKIIQSLSDSNEDWAQKTLSILRKRSPTSLYITFRELTQAKHKNFDECMKTERYIASQIGRGNDFLEGIRAAIIDKDRNPQWEPATLEELDPENIDIYFPK